MISGRERHDYNGAKTALTDEEWMRAAAKRGDWVVLVDGREAGGGNWLLTAGHWFLNRRAGRRVVFCARRDHNDYLRRVAEAAVVAS
jgi:hypothetical protein